MKPIDKIKEKLAEVEKLDKKIKVGTFTRTTMLHYNNEGFIIFVIIKGLIRTSLGYPYITIDDFNYSPQFNTRDIKAVDLFVDSIPVSKFKRAITGALLFGGVGAVAGALSTINAKPKSKISLIVYFDSIELSSVSISCKDIGEASRVISTLANLEAHLSGDNMPDKNIGGFDRGKLEDSSTKITDEITKLKKMLDDGIIDQEEFKMFKKKIID